MRKAVIICMLLVPPALATLLSLEAESSKGQFPVRPRFEASERETIIVTQKHLISLPFCLMQPTKVKIAYIGYTNDGGEDTVQVTVDRNVIGSFTSKNHTRNGEFWNVLEKSGHIGDVMALDTGIHHLKLWVESTDIGGIELDNAVLDVGDAFLHKGSKTFTCELPCIQQSPVLISQSVEPIPDGYMKQNSYPTECAEEDNVDISVFHPSVSEYSITATPPLYHSLVNHRYEDTSNCVFLPPEYWTFADVNMHDLLNSASLMSNGATLTLSDFNVGGPVTPLEFAVTFRLEGRSVGHLDSEIGSQLELTLGNIKSDAQVSLFVKGRAGVFIKNPPITFTNASPNNTWNLADFTWKEHYDNGIVLKIVTDQTGNLTIKHLELERRYMGPDKPFGIFSNSEVMIEGVDVDFWWRAPETMQVSLSTGQTWTNTDYLRISVPVPWNTTWSQVLVLYQDGNLRLLPIALPGTDWIPFGTSVVVGQTNPDDHRPVAPISSVLINPADLTLDITYRDGGFARLELLTLVEETKVIVKNLILTKNTTTHPFATFRSMFVDAGNDDSDSVLTDTSGPDHVMGEWGEMWGTSFLVYRRCESSHLTQSPDLRVDISKA